MVSTEIFGEGGKSGTFDFLTIDHNRQLCGGHTVFEDD
eukprot:CAMPEP_0170819886 /NCGR_PEP_ID=MMETSP0733-20121128/41917_1 /TAXON_ID=186038 /ORGANISM="Fragilariopsis kerguelensis, Strain L26-C5" /LENGTH=37 /DNA_ID= /DNA_START= /DNA_END= /DNA_ORIENTATION=